MENGLIIHIGGDDSAFRQTLRGLENAAADTVGALGSRGEALARELEGRLAQTLERIEGALPELSQALTRSLQDALTQLDPGGSAHQAGIELGNALADGIRAAGTNINTAASTVAGSAASAGNFNTAYTKMYGAGKYVMAGLKAGLASKADEIYALCKQVADKIAEVTSAALEVNSPSKVFMRIGRSTGEGFELGVRDSMQNAVKAAQDVVSNMNLNTRVLPDFEGAISGAVTSVYAAENSRPIYLNVNGKSLARVISKDTQQATNNANRRVGLGVGK